MGSSATLLDNNSSSVDDVSTCSGYAGRRRDSRYVQHDARLVNNRYSPLTHVTSPTEAREVLQRLGDPLQGKMSDALVM